MHFVFSIKIHAFSVELFTKKDLVSLGLQVLGEHLERAVAVAYRDLFITLGF